MTHRLVHDSEPDVRFVAHLTLAFPALVVALLAAAAWGLWGQCAPLLGRAICAWLFGGNQL